MKFIRKLNKVVFLSLFLFCSGVVMAFAASQDVNVTNWISTIAVTNSTWDQRLNYIQTATQGAKADLDTLLNRFGFNSLNGLDDALSLMYSQQQSINSSLSSVVSNGAILVSSSDSDILDAFDREFPVGNPVSNDLTSKWYLREIALKLNRSASNSPNGLITVDERFATLNSLTNHIDSDLHSLSSTIDDINSDVSSIHALANSNLPAIKVNTGNIEIDTTSIYSRINTYYPRFNTSLNTLISNTDGIHQDTNTLREFFADADTIAQKAAAKQSSDVAVNSFTGNGSGAASAQDYGNINSFSDALKSSFGSNISTSHMTDVLSGVGNSWGWFSQDTYNSINPSSSSSRRSLTDDYSVESYMALYEQLEHEGVPDPLDDFYADIEDALK